ncbi:MAG: Mur ligase domain-containing protein [Elusimicrobiaceae bacterium]|nr:Mur ligase domain-containing protein [Elusimicrobiaceae bacterium]
MQLNLTLRKAADIIQAKFIGENPEEKMGPLVADSRVLSPGDTFIALKGNQYDARQFIPQALKKGVRAVIAQEAGFTVPHTS